MSKLKFKDTNTVVPDGLGILLLSNSGQKLEVYDMAQAKFFEATLVEDVVVVDPPIDVPVDPTPVDPPTDPVEPPPIDPPPLPVETEVANAMALTAALNVANAGDTITLASGFYGDFTYTGKTFVTPVKIVSLDPANPATFRSITLTRVKGLILESIAVKYTPNAATKDTSAGITGNSVSNLTITKCKIEGGPSVVDGLLIGRGIYTTDSDNLTISNCDISKFRRGIQTPKTNSIKILYNHIHDLRTTPIGGGTASDVLIEGNHLEGSSPNNFGGAGDHGDFIHYWTQPTQVGANKNFVIRNNFIEQGDGIGILGIYMDNNTNPQGFENVVIENNILHNSNGQGMRLEDIDGLVVRNNTLLQSEGIYNKAPRIRIEAGCKNVQIINNIVSDSTTGGAMPPAPGSNITEVGTLEVQYNQPTALNYQGDIFVGMPKVNGTIADMQKKPGLYPLIGANLTPDMITPLRKA